LKNCCKKKCCETANAVVDQIRTAHGRADAVPADLAAPDGPHALTARVRNLIGVRLDIIVSNAGISNATSFENMTVKQFDDLFAVNVRAPIEKYQAVRDRRSTSNWHRLVCCDAHSAAAPGQSRSMRQARFVGARQQ
jgi:NAD(P)-dependent dehydrogenase (short-subunit alcohol dehydrogenase family)